MLIKIKECECEDGMERAGEEQKALDLHEERTEMREPLISSLIAPSHSNFNNDSQIDAW